MSGLDKAIKFFKGSLVLLGKKEGDLNRPTTPQPPPTPLFRQDFDERVIPRSPRPKASDHIKRGNPCPLRCNLIRPKNCRRN